MNERKRCKYCDKPIPLTRRRNAIYCSKDCKLFDIKKRYHSLNPQSTLAPTASGAVSEYKVIIDLLNRGFEVFRSVEPGSTCDLAILKNNKLLKLTLVVNFSKLVVNFFKKVFFLVGVNYFH